MPVHVDVGLAPSARRHTDADWRAALRRYRMRRDNGRVVVTKTDDLASEFPLAEPAKSSVVRRKREVMNEMDNMTKVGGTVIYTDGYRRDHDALVTAVWGPNCINVVFCSGDGSKEDTYGRQIERETSVSRYDAATNNFGRCVRDVGVDAVFVEHPQSK